MKFRDRFTITLLICAGALSPSAVSALGSSQDSGTAVSWGAESGDNHVVTHGERHETVAPPQPAEQPEPSSPPETTVQYSDSHTKLAIPHGNCKSYQDEHKKMRAACNLAPDPELSEPSAEPTVITLTTREAATLIASGSGITRQPPGSKVIISKAFIVYTNPAVRYQTTTILGTSIEVEFTPVSYTWGWGDGTTTTTTDPGAPYPHQTVTHHYQHTATGVTTTLTTTWTTRFRPAGESSWRPIEGTITTTETSTPYDLVRIITYLTDDAEQAQGH